MWHAVVCIGVCLVILIFIFILSRDASLELVLADIYSTDWPTIAFAAKLCYFAACGHKCTHTQVARRGLTDLTGTRFDQAEMKPQDVSTEIGLC